MTTSVERDTKVGSFEAWGYDPIDFDAFHRVELPRRLATGVNEQVAWDVVGAAPIALQLTDGRAYSYTSGDAGVVIEPGVVVDAEVVLEIDQHDWQNYVHEFRNPTSLILSQAIRFLRGDNDAWEAWKPAMRCMYSGKPVYNPDDAGLVDREDAPLDLHRSFSLDRDEPDEMSHFLRTAGFIVRRGAMSHRLAEVTDEIERLKAATPVGDPFSYWTTDETTGDRVLYRMLYMGERSPLIRSLADEDPTIAAVVALAREDLVPVHDRAEGELGLLKEFGPQADVSAALAANISWHQDCGLGGCPITCPSINLGIQIDAANRDSSQLYVLAGSHGKVGRRTYPFAEDGSAPIVAIETEPGDVTVHYGCALHASPPPTGTAGRRTAYLPFYSPKIFDLLGPFQGFQQVIPGWGTGDLPHLNTVAGTLY
jgi:ectoine hydroxylase-related dioxygenase (phytanoyl-CoA dioxygenase family)